MEFDARVRRTRRANQFKRFLIVSAAALISTASTVQEAGANSDTRSLTFFHTHTKETATITFRRNGAYDEEALKQLNWLLRDWRVSEPAKMDPRLFDILWEVYREVGSREPIHVISAYRSPATNSMLRNRSRGVSENSQHMSGKAMDIRLPDVDTGRLRAAAMQMQYGGVGYYPSSAFVHVDTGSVRAWPRMSRDQLARLFPNGKTAHLPSNGQPLFGYEEARAEIDARNAQLAVAGGGSLGSLFASLLAGSGERPSPNTPRNASLFTSSGNPGASARTMVPAPPPRPASQLNELSQRTPEPADPSVVPSSGGTDNFPPDEQTAMQALFSTKANEVASQPRAGLTIVRVQPRPIPVGSTLVNLSPLLELGFASDAIDELSVTHFTGPAVKQLAKLRYAAAFH